MDALLSPREKRRRDVVRSFARARLVRRGPGPFDAAAGSFGGQVRAAAAAGYCGLAAPASLGGARRTAAEIIVTLEEIAAAAPVLGLGLAAHNFLCLEQVLLAGTAAQRDVAGRRLASGRAWGTWSLAACLAAPGGNAAAGPGPVARREVNAWILENLDVRGRELPAETMIVFARIEAAHGGDGLTAFLWNRRKTPLPDRRTGRLRLPDDARLGGEGEARRTAEALQERANLFFAAAFVGAAAAVHRECLALARERGAFASTLFEPAAVQTGLADAFVDLGAARLMVRRAAWRADKRRLDAGETAAVKTTARAVALALLETGLRLDPGPGDWPELRDRIARACPDALDPGAPPDPGLACGSRT